MSPRLQRMLEIRVEYAGGEDLYVQPYSCAINSYDGGVHEIEAELVAAIDAARKGE